MRRDCAPSTRAAAISRGGGLKATCRAEASTSSRDYLLRGRSERGRSHEAGPHEDAPIASNRLPRANARSRGHQGEATPTRLRGDCSEDGWVTYKPSNVTPLESENSGSTVVSSGQAFLGGPAEEVTQLRGRPTTRTGSQAPGAPSSRERSRREDQSRSVSPLETRGPSIRTAARESSRDGGTNAARSVSSTRNRHATTPDRKGDGSFLPTTSRSRSTSVTSGGERNVSRWEADVSDKSDSSAACEERRVAEADGEAYTYQEFMDYYGTEEGHDQWDQSYPVPKPGGHGASSHGHAPCVGHTNSSGGTTRSGTSTPKFSSSCAGLRAVNYALPASSHRSTPGSRKAQHRAMLSR